MHPVSARFLDGIRRPHRVVSYVDLIDQTTGRVSSVSVVSGQVSIDRTQDVRRSCQITFAAPNAANTLVSNVLNPYTTTLLVRRGLRYGDGMEETAPLGRFVIDDLGWTEDNTVVEVTGSDLTKLVQRATNVQTRVVSSPSTLALISSLIAEVFSTTPPGALPSPRDNLLIDQAVVDQAVSRYEISDQDRWSVITDLALTLGCEIFADHMQAKFRIQPLPSSTGPAVWTVDAGADGVLVDYHRAVSRLEVVNAVYATNGGSNDLFPVAAWAYDNNPVSPTYVGTYGWSVETISSTAYSTTLRAQTAAAAYLNSHLGLLNSLDLTAVPNPALVAGDVIAVLYPDGTTEKHIIDSLAITLEPGTFSVVTRATQTPLAGALIGQPQEVSDAL